MAISAADIIVNISARGAEGVGQTFDSLGGKLESTGKTAMKWGAGLTIGVTAPLAFMAKTSVTAASDLNESMSKTNVLFGDAADGIINWAGDTTDSLFMTQSAALDYASAYGGMLDGMGLGNQEMADMSMNLTNLTGDFASFHNLDPAEAFTVMMSAMAGETEAIRRYGVDVSAAAVEQKALEMGLAGTAGELTEADKKLARYNLILEQTTEEQGDAARTAGGYANMQRRMQEQLGNLSAQIGQIMLPIMTRFVGALTGLFKGFSMLPKSFQTAIVILGALAAAVGPVLTVIGALTSGAGILVGAIGALLSPIGLIVAAVAALGYAVYYAYTNNLAGFKDMILEIKDAFGLFKPALDDVMDAFQALQEGNFAEVWDELKEAFTSFSDVLPEFKERVADAIGGFVENLKAIDWGGIASSIGENLASAFGSVDWGGLLSTAASALYSVASTLIAGLRAGAEAAWPYVSDWLSQIPGLVSDAVGIGWDFLKEKGAILIGSLLDGFSQAWPGVYAWLSMLPGFVAEALGTFGTFMLETGSELLSDLLNGLVSQWPTVYAWLSRLGTFMLDAIGSLAELLVARGAEALSGLITGIVGMWPTVYAWLAGLGGFMFNAVGSLARTLRDRGLEAIAGVYDGVLDKWASLKGWLLLLGTYMYIAVGNLSRFLRDKGVDAISGVYDGVLDRWAALKGWLSGLGTYIVISVGYLGSKLYSAGVDAMAGLANGIIAGASSMVSSAISWAIGLLPSWAQKILKSASPSKVMMAIGHDAIEGLSIGISQAAASMLPSTMMSVGDYLTGGYGVPAYAAPIGAAAPISAGMQTAPAVVNNVNHYHVTPDEFLKLMRDAEAGGAVARNLATELRYW